MPPANPRSESKITTERFQVPQSPSGNYSAFVDIEKLRNAEGIIAIISQRRSNGTVTIAVMKEFERDGHMETTAFISETLFEAYQEMVALAVARVRELRETGSLPIKPHV